MKFLWALILLIFLSCDISNEPPPSSCLDNALIVIEALKDTYPLVVVEGDYYPDERHVECFYWEDGRWKCGYWTGYDIREREQDYRFSATVYSYEEYLERVRMYGWR